MKQASRSVHGPVLNLVLIAAVLWAALPLAHAAPAETMPESPVLPQTGESSTSSEASVPSPPAGGPRPSINLGSTHGYMGQSIEATGTGVAPYPGVRLAWLVEGMTRTAAEATTGSGQAYSASLRVPGDVEPGPAKICAAVTGAEVAEFVCKSFTIDAAPPGTVSGQIPLSTAASPRVWNLSGRPAMVDEAASVVLQARSGGLTYLGPIAADGTFSIDDVPPGTYTAYVKGSTPVPLDSLVVDVGPNQNVQMTFVYVQPSICEIVDPTVGVAAIHATPGGIEDWGMFGALGIYVRNGPSLPVTFEANLNGELDQVLQVEFYYRYDGKHKLLGIDATPPFDSAQISYDVSTLEAGDWTDLFVKPIMQGGCAETASRRVVLVENPMAAPLIQNGTLSWNPTLNRYDFSGTVPVLPSQDWLVQKDWEISEINVTFQNRVDGRLELEGSLYPNGDVELRLFQGHRRARLCSVDVLDRRESYLGEDHSFPLSFPSETSLYALNVPYQYHKSDIKTPTVEVFRFTYGIPYVAELRFSIDIGIQGGVWFDGEFYPWLGKLSAWLQPVVGVELGLTVEVILLFFVRGGAKLTTELGVGFPTSVETFQSPAVKDPGTCLYIDIWAKIFAKLLFWKKTLWKDTIVKTDSPEGCHWDQQTLGAQEDEDVPRVMPAPVVASDPYGRMLWAYIEDTTPTAETPTPKVMVRWWNLFPGEWGTATALTDGSHTVSDPAVALVGSDGQALVAWTQNTLTPATDPGDDPVDLMARQEIYYTFWDGYAWRPPQRLTDDLMPDGLASLAGDDGGATLAWARDGDGDYSTRADWQIAWSQWDVSGQKWGAVNLLTAAGLAPALSQGTRAARSPGAAELMGPFLPSSPAAELRVCSSGCVYSSVQAAVDAANPGDVIKVASGTYTGVQVRSGMTQTVYLDKDVTIQGGYATSNWTIPDPENQPTTLDAQGLGRVFYIDGASPTIAGLRVTGGDATGLGSLPSVGDGAGGGILVLEGAPTIRNNEVYDNIATKGGGLCLYNSEDASLEGNAIHENSATTGGGVYLNAIGQDWPNLHDNVISDNDASSSGGGLFILADTAYATASQAVPGAAPSSHPWQNNVIADNYSFWTGGGIYAELSNSDTPAPVFLHTTLARNISEQEVDGAWFQGDFSQIHLTNTVAVDHDTALWTWNYGTLYIDGVLWYGNTHNIGDAGSYVVTHAYTGTPAFAPDGYHLTVLSEAIDRGQDAGVAADIDGDARPEGAAPDLGADEYVAGTIYPVMNAQPDVARKGTRIGLVWTVDADGDPGTSDDRRLALADCTGGTCDVQIPAALPTGADSPSIVLKGSDQIHLAFLVRDDGELGNQAALWTADYGNHGGTYNWQAAPVVDEQGQQVLAEAPQLSTTASGETLLAFRLFGAPGTDAYLGQRALSQVDAYAEASPPLLFSSELPQWQVNVGIDQASNQATLLSVGLPATTAATQSARPALAPALTTAQPHLASSLLVAGSEPLTSLTIDPDPDPALDPALVLSQQHAAPGTSVVVTATVRNVGRQPASGLMVRLYLGDPGTGVLIGTKSVAGPLGMNESEPVLFNVTAGSGQQPLSARVSTSGGDASSENNTATGDLGELPAPDPVLVGPSALSSHALEVRWLAPGVPGVAGYRILRSETAGGPYQLVGEAEGTVYHDLLLALNHPYYYVVQAFDAAGVRSPYSSEGSGELPGHTVFLPLVLRNATVR